MIKSNDRLARDASPYDGGMPDPSEASELAGGGRSAGGCGETLADDLGWGLGVVFRAYLAAAEAALSGLPAGPRGYQVLAAAAQGRVASQLALAQHLAIDRTVMTYLLDDLEAEGLVERRADPADRRARHVTATAKGRDLLTGLDDDLRAAEDHLLAPLDGEARQAFRAQLRVLAVRLNSFDPQPNPCELVARIDAGLPTPGRA
jgi:DNA-binding MarR family transcriptional regulator